MSAFSDWKCGAISEEEFYDLAAREARQDAYLDEKAEREAYYEQGQEDESDLED